MTKKSKKQKEYNTKKSFIELFKYIKTYLPFVIFSIILSIISSISSIIGPDKLKDITNIITEGLFTSIDTNKVKSIGIFLIIIFAVGALAGYFQGFIMAGVTAKISKKMRSEISHKINNLPLKYFDKTSFGDILSRVTNDVDTIGWTLQSSITTMVSSITLFLGSLIMMFVTDYRMAIVAVLSSLIGFSFMAIILSKSQKYFDQAQESLGKLNGHIEEVYSNHNIVKVYNATENELKEFDKVNEELYKNTRKSQFLGGLMPPFMGFIANFGYVAVCVTGAILVIKHNMDFGVIVAFMIYVRLFTQPLNQMAHSVIDLQQTAAASNRVFDFLKAKEIDKEEKTKYLNPKDVKGLVEFKKVRFGYDEDKTVIKGFSAKCNPGEKIAIVGPTGAGKTTMVNLLMKFYDINSGDIKIDNTSVKDLTRENIHDLFTMVLQDTWLFSDTIKNNIKYNNKDISDEDVKKVCKIVGLDYFIKTLPKGYDTILNEEDSLSAGQKQLLTIARAMLIDKPLLIFDEATSSVDTRTESLVSKAMDKLTKGKTSFIIAHRLSTIKNADLILVVKDGNIVEQGTHKDLLKQKGFYTEIYNSQFDTE